MQSILLVSDNNGMPRVCPSCISDNGLGILGKVINHLTLAFVPPLGTNNYNIHSEPPEISKTVIIHGKKNIRQIKLVKKEVLKQLLVV